MDVASADASFRRYLRVRGLAGHPARIVMDAPPDKEDCRPFVRVAELMRDAGLHAPHVLEWDEASGFMLLTDLGHATMMSALDSNARPTRSRCTCRRWTSCCLGSGLHATVNYPLMTGLVAP